MVKECIVSVKDKLKANENAYGVYRQLNWWEHYPLHKIWCNDYCPLVPRFVFRKGDQWNSNAYSLHWLIFHIWTMENFSFGIDVDISPTSITAGLILPYLRIRIGFPFIESNFARKICDKLRRKPLIKNGDSDD